MIASIFHLDMLFHFVIRVCHKIPRVVDTILNISLKQSLTPSEFRVTSYTFLPVLFIHFPWRLHPTLVTASHVVLHSAMRIRQLLI